MNKKQIEAIAGSLGWTVEWYSQRDGTKFVTFQKYSPACQDFSIQFDYKNLDEIAGKVNDYYESYDPSQEAYYWLGNDGHGKNGSPDTMLDVYKDMVACEQMTKALYEALVSNGKFKPDDEELEFAEEHGFGVGCTASPAKAYVQGYKDGTKAMELKLCDLRNLLNKATEFIQSCCYIDTSDRTDLLTELAKFDITCMLEED